MQTFPQEVSKGMRAHGNAWACFLGLLITMPLAQTPEPPEEDSPRVDVPDVRRLPLQEAQERRREQLEAQERREQIEARERREQWGEEQEFKLEIPDVRRLPLQEAQEQLEQWGQEQEFKLAIALIPAPLPKGAQRDEILVVEQEPLGPTRSPFPQRRPFVIRLQLGAEVPDVTGHTLEEARQDLRQRGLVAQAPEDAGEDRIIQSQRPHAGKVMPIPGRVAVQVEIPPPLYGLILSVAVGLGLIAIVAVVRSIRSGRGQKQRRWVEQHVQYRLNPGSFLARAGPSRGYAGDRGGDPS